MTGGRAETAGKCRATATADRTIDGRVTDGPSRPYFESGSSVSSLSLRRSFFDRLSLRYGRNALMQLRSRRTATLKS